MHNTLLSQLPCCLAHQCHLIRRIHVHVRQRNASSIPTEEIHQEFAATFMAAMASNILYYPREDVEPQPRPHIPVKMLNVVVLGTARLPSLLALWYIR